MGGDAIWAFCEAIARRVHEVNLIKQAAKEARRKEKAKQRYQLRKRLGLIKKRPTKAEIAAKAKEEELYRDAYYRDLAQSCHCHLGHPPCSFCTSPEREEEE